MLLDAESSDTNIIRFEKGVNMPDISIILMKADNLDFAYNLYCENNAFIDEFVYDKPILDADKHYNKHDFMEILDDEKVKSYLAINKKIMNKNTNPYFLSDPIGFISYEIMDADKAIKIVFLEVKNKDTELYSTLLKHLFESAQKSKKIKKISIDIEDGQYALMKIVCGFGFKKVKCLHPTNNNPDIFIFEKKIEFLEETVM